MYLASASKVYRVLRKGQKKDENPNTNAAPPPAPPEPTGAAPRSRISIGVAAFAITGVIIGAFVYKHWEARRSFIAPADLESTTIKAFLSNLVN